MKKAIKIVVHQKKIRIIKYDNQRYYVEIRIGWWIWAKWVQINPSHKTEQDAIVMFNKIKKNPNIVKFRKNG